MEDDDIRALKLELGMQEAAAGNPAATPAPAASDAEARALTITPGATSKANAVAVAQGQHGDSPRSTAVQAPAAFPATGEQTPRAGTDETPSEGI